MDTSTSYMEAMNLPIGEWFDFVDAISDVCEEKKKFFDDMKTEKG